MSNFQKLSESTFLTVVANTPLVSFDLIVRNQAGQVLLGLRNNRPAQGYWFVPGGRIMKDERLAEAFLRITENELGQSIPLSEGKFLGVFQHLYEDNFSNQEGISTHYIVFGVEISADEVLAQKPLAQHSDWRWWSIQDLLASAVVHPYTRAYFDREQKTKIF